MCPRIREVRRPHYVVIGMGRGRLVAPARRLVVPAKQVWTRWGLQSCGRALIVTMRRRLVAFLRFDLRRGGDEHELHAHGSWVEPSRRGRGIATKLWIRALRRYRPNKVRVTVVSRSGTRLVRRLQALFPKIRWKILNFVG